MLNLPNVLSTNKDIPESGETQFWRGTRLLFRLVTVSVEIFMLN